MPVECLSGVSASTATAPVHAPAAESARAASASVEPVVSTSSTSRKRRPARPLSRSETARRIRPTRLGAEAGLVGVVARETEHPRRADAAAPEQHLHRRVPALTVRGGRRRDRAHLERRRGGCGGESRDDGGAERPGERSRGIRSPAVLEGADDGGRRTRVFERGPRGEARAFDEFRPGRQRVEARGADAAVGRAAPRTGDRREHGEGVSERAIGEVAKPFARRPRAWWETFEAAIRASVAVVPSSTNRARRPMPATTGLAGVWRTSRLNRTAARRRSGCRALAPASRPRSARRGRHPRSAP